MIGGRCAHCCGATRRAPSSIIASNSVRNWAANPGSRTTTFASRAISSEYGSMFDDPTVAQPSSMTATFACRNDREYSWIAMPPSIIWPYSARDA
jgi:hypothetical protein